MNIYFDTEFTGLVPDTKLISIGMVTENGEKFYAEFTDYDKSLITPWIQENVIDNLLHNDHPEYFLTYENNTLSIKGPTKWIAMRLMTWFEEVSNAQYEIFDSNGLTIQANPYAKQIQLVADVCHYDMYLFANQIFGGAFNMPENINPVCYDICQDIADLDGIEKLDTRKRPFPLKRIQAGAWLKYHDKIGDWDISADQMAVGFDASREKLCAIYNKGKLPDGNKHNALYDAEVVKMIYEGMRRFK